MPEVQETEGDEYFLGTVTQERAQDKSPWTVTLKVNSTPVKFKIDCGADVSVMTRSQYNKLATRPKLREDRSTLRGVGGKLRSDGVFSTTVSLKDHQYNFDIHVVPESENNLLSRSVSQMMDLIELKIGEVSEDVFGECGKLNTEPVKIQLREGATPYHVRVARRIPLPLMSSVTKELQRMENAEVIQKITEPTDWCSPLVVTRKKTGGVRLCVDLRVLNKAVLRERYMIPTIEDVKVKLAGGHVFTSLDAASGYYQIPLDQDSQKLTTFMTPQGRYCFRRLPFGITSASELFQRKMGDLFDGLEGVAVYQDDIIVTGSSLEEHDERLNEVLNIIKQAGLKLNKAKCSFRRESLEFLGHTFTKDGVKADMQKVAAIKNMAPPTNVKELRRILGMVNFLGCYVPQLATIIQPLNELLHKDAVWAWDTTQAKAFSTIKEMLSKSPVLHYFDPSLPVVVAADASSYGLGAVLYQVKDSTKHPVAYASRTLLPSEQRYAQIEKELLASVWACEKFQRYLIGLESFTLLTDHKPLVTFINHRDLDQVPVRCQRLLMRLMRFAPKAEYISGEKLYVADTLSRHPVDQPSSNDEMLDNQVNCHVEEVISMWPASDDRLDEIRNATKNDEILTGVANYTLHGWPKYVSDVPEVYKQYHSVRAHLSIANGLVLYDNRIVVPRALQPEMLQKIHAGHMGIAKCRERAGSSVWWQGIGRDISNMVDSCQFCQQNRPTQRKQPLITTDLPGGPWERIAADMCSHKSQEYLVVTDYYSRYLEVVHMKTTTSHAVVMSMKNLFARWGVPYEMVSDNGPQFRSREFQIFAEEYGFNHVTSSPHQPHANGAAEKAVHIAKSILKQEDPFKALMAYRSTPIAATGYSPSQLIMGRVIRTTLPTLPRNLEPAWPDQEKVKDNDDRAKSSYRYYYNRRYSTKPLPPVSAGDNVLVRTNKDSDWSKTGTVVQPDGVPSTRSENIQLSDGNTLRRDRQDIKLNKTVINDGENQAKEPPSSVSSPSSARDRPKRTIKPPKRLIES